MRKIFRGQALGLVGLTLFTQSALADAGNGPYYGHMMGGGWFMGPFMMLIGLAVVVVAVVLVARMLGMGGGATSGRAAPSSALQILEERIARGEIDNQEFEDRKKILSG